MPDITDVTKLNTDAEFSGFQEKFTVFLQLLDRRSKILKKITEFEERARGKHPAGINQIKSSLAAIQCDLALLTEYMVNLGGEKYEAISSKAGELDASIRLILPGSHPIVEDDFTIPFNEFGRERSYSVGSKNAQLGEIKSRLNLPTPEGFAITAWAYKTFMEYNNLPELITRLIEYLDLKRYEKIRAISERLQNVVVNSPVPQELVHEIEKSYRDLLQHTTTKSVALRSSGIWEDTHFSFAGQYASILNVQSDDLINQYRRVLAGQFTPQALYYLLSHSLETSEIAMSVGCVEMIDCEASGVIYTVDPVNPASGNMLVSSIWGLGKFLVDGTVNPDEFVVSRNDCTQVMKRIVRKPIELVGKTGGGTIQIDVPDDKSKLPSLTDDQICELSKYALELESHYYSPQDIEWAIDRNNNISILQTRPLRLAAHLQREVDFDASSLNCLFSGGATVSPGAGSGKVIHAHAPGDLPEESGNFIVIAQVPFPGLITVMDKINALVTCGGSVASHMATVAREFTLPTLVGLDGAMSIPEGTEVTIDASGRAIYDGLQPELVRSRRIDPSDSQETPIRSLLKDVRAKIVPLYLLDPADENFKIEECKTYHDIARFIHQQAMEEMFSGALDFDSTKINGLRLRSDIPLPVDIIFLNKELPDKAIKKGYIKEIHTVDTPLGPLWEGIKIQGWPAKMKSSHLAKFRKQLPLHLSSSDRHNFAKNSFAILSDEYMVLSLHLGYHFTTIETMCTGDHGKNYIRFQHKGGGAIIEKRLRREKLLADIFESMKFKTSSTGDYIEAKISYLTEERVKEKLVLIGRLMMLTKQLDMALSSDRITEWYKDDIKQQLGLSSS